MFYINNNKVQFNYNLSGDGDPDGDLSPRGTGMGKKCPPQAFAGIPAGKFFRRGDEFGELKPDREFPVAIPSPRFESLSSPHRLQQSWQECRQMQQQEVAFG
jgi:hypothetical protein